MKGTLSPHIPDSMTLRSEWKSSWGSSFLRRRLLDLIGVGLASVSVAGCIDLNRPVGQVASPCLSGGGTVVQDTFLVSVSDARWTDRAMRAGMDGLSEAQRAAVGEQAYVRPQAEFLVIDLQIENTARQPMSWASRFGSYGKSYKLINRDGVVYGASPHASSVIFATTGGNINPGMSAHGPVVFDVPRADYDFVIEHTRYTGTAALIRYFAGTEVFRCSLSVA